MPLVSSLSSMLLVDEVAVLVEKMVIDDTSMDNLIFDFGQMRIH